MPLIDLIVNADFENVYSFAPAEGEFRYYLRLKCTSCGDEPEDFVYVDPGNIEEVPGGRGQANFTRKCKNCSKSANLTVMAGGEVLASQPDSVLATFDCRGCEPCDWRPQGEEAWACFANTVEGDPDDPKDPEPGTAYAVTFEEGEWCGYDEATEQSLMISNLQCSFATSKRSGGELTGKLSRIHAHKTG
uniref:Uncharacterized protein n=1 Tax=Oxyrrhis marina TaxID=2969 RepID=A0A7S3UKA1_OXYMA